MFTLTFENMHTGELIKKESFETRKEAKKEISRLVRKEGYTRG